MRFIRLKRPWHPLADGPIHGNLGKIEKKNTT